MNEILETLRQEIEKESKYTIKEFQEKHGFKNKEVAELLGITESQVDHIRAGRSSETKQTIILIKEINKHIRIINKRIEKKYKSFQHNIEQALKKYTELGMSRDEALGMIKKAINQ